MSLCAKHPSHKIKCLCIEKVCHNRLACEECIDVFHQGHSVIMIKRGLRQFMNLHKNSEYMDAEENKSIIDQYYSQLRAKTNQIDQKIKQWKQSIDTNLFTKFKALSSTFSLQYFDYVWEKLQIQEHDYEKFIYVKSQNPYRHREEVEEIAQDIRFLNNEAFDSPLKIMKATKIIHKEIYRGLKQCKSSIDEALQRFQSLAEEYNFTNIDHLSQRKQEQSLPSLTPRERIYQISPINSQRGVVRKRRKRSTNKDILRKRVSLEKDKVNLHDENRSRKEFEKVASIRITRDEIALQAKPGQQISSEEIISFLREQPVSKETLRFQINGLNRFDEECLQILCSKYPNLKKLYYSFNFDDNAIITSREQVFKTKTYQISDSQISIDSSNLSILSKLPQLENLLIGEKSLSLKTFKIKNRKIKHITIGQNHKKKKEHLSINLIRQIVSNFQLLTLNLFNIYSIPTTFLNKIFQAHKKLKQLWISGSSYYQGDLFRNLKNSRLQSLILDQIKLKDPIHLPESLENLIIDNCALDHEIKGIDECRRGFKNFSLFECEYISETQNNGDQIMSKLSQTSKKTLEYLNLGSNPSLSENCLSTLGEMTNLKYLCLNNSKIALTSIILLKITNLKQLEMLDVSGTKISTSQTIQLLGDMFSQIQYLCMDAMHFLKAEHFKGFKNLKKLTLWGTEIEQIKNLKRTLQGWEIDVDILPH